MDLKILALVFNFVLICWPQTNLNIDQKLNFKDLSHKYFVPKSWYGTQLRVLLQRLSKTWNKPSRMQIFRCFILPHFKYCSLVWNFYGKVNSAKLEFIQYR